ncbi:MAG: oligosaccharide flippase family protein [Anaerolineae bacterium]|nr:oligosaccharide flippase family protein [Anaerolineae bacterium]
MRAAAKPVQPLPLRVNFSWTFIGNTIYAACQWGMLAVMSKAGSSAMIGYYSLGLAVTAPVIMLTNLQLRYIQATDATREYGFNDYFTLRLISTFAGLLVIAIMGLTLYNVDKANVILLVGLFKGIEAIGDIIYGRFQQSERMDRVAISKIAKGIGGLASFGIAVYFSQDLLIGLITQTVFCLLVMLLYDTKNLRQMVHFSVNDILKVGQSLLQSDQRWKRIARLMMLALPLGITTMLVSLRVSVPRFFIEHYLGENELGIYTALAYIQTAGNTVVALALGQSASPRMASYYRDGKKRAFLMLQAKLVVIGLLLGGAGALFAGFFGELVLSVLYTPEYAAYTHTFVWIMLSSAFVYVATLLETGLIASRRLVMQIPVLVLTVLASAAFCYGLVPAQGIFGAAVALLATSIVQVVLYLVIFAVPRGES